MQSQPSTNPALIVRSWCALLLPNC